MLGFLKKKRRVDIPAWHPDRVLLDLGGIPWTWRSAFESTVVLGATGAGKSSVGIAALVRALAQEGQGGGGAFCVKREDGGSYQRMFERAGRGDDVIIFSPAANPLRFNFLAEEIRQMPDATGLAENLTALVMLVSELADRSRQGGSSSGENAEYFRQATLRLCRFAFFVLILSDAEVTVTNLYRLVISAPRSRAEARETSWQSGSFFFACMRAAAAKQKNPSQHADCELAITFFMEEWCELSPKTRSSVESTLTAATDMLSRGMVRDTLCATTTNFSPEMLESGKLVIFDYPVLVHREVGQTIQVVIKACLQRWLSRRAIADGTRPVFLIADECQHLIVREDERFATTIRSTRAAMVWATQSLSTLLEAFGGDSAEPRMHSFLANAGTQLHFQQTDTRTIAYLQQLTGRSKQIMLSGGQSRSNDWLVPLMGSEDGSVSASFSEQWVEQLQASDLNGLKKAGTPHFYAEMILYRGGHRLANGKSWMRIAMPQPR